MLSVAIVDAGSSVPSPPRAPSPRRAAPRAPP